MTEAVKTPSDSGATSAANGSSHVTLAIQDMDGGLNPDIDRAAQNSNIKRIKSHAAILRGIDKRSQVVIRFEDVCAWVPTLVIPGGTGQENSSPLNRCFGKAQADDEPKQQPPKERQILFGITGEVNPGEVLALMGPSGGGKTSLLTLLAGRSTARLEGAITFNGAKMSKPVKRKLGYVMQDDLLYAELTVYETLYFAAMLRLPQSCSRTEKLQRVDMVVEGLGLERCRDTIIGSHMMRGVSGGERKRVSIGHELLINPSMLLLDEPTSGLDSTTALRLMHTLRTLASGGRTIVTSIHQPSSRLYRQMDKLMLLAQGHCMYYGDAQCVTTWFKLLGQPCPFGTNIADHILDLANGDVLTYGGTVMSAQADLVLVGGGSSLRRRGAAVATTGGDSTAAAADDDDDDERLDDRIGVRATATPVGGGDGLASALAVSTVSAVPVLEDTAEDIHRRLLESFAKRTIGLGRGGIRAAELEALERGGTAPVAASAGSETKGALPAAKPAAANGDASPSPKAAVSTSGALGAIESGEAEAAGGKDDKWGAPWFEQVKHLTLRSVKTRRFQSLSSQKFIQLLVVAVLAGLFWWQIGRDLDDTQALLDVGGLLFFIELFMGFASLFAALFTFPTEFQMLVKERQSGMYRLSAYYVARTLSDLPMDCLLPSLFVWVIYWMAGLRVDAGAFFAHWASVLLIVLTSQSIGLLIGATVMNPQNGQTVATIIMLATMLVGGYYVRGIPVWIAWLKYVSFIYWGWNLLLKIEFDDRGFDCKLIDGWLIGATGCDVKDSDAFDIDVNAPVTREVCVLIGMLIFLRLCIYYALQYKTTFKGRH